MSSQWLHRQIYRICDLFCSIRHCAFSSPQLFRWDTPPTIAGLPFTLSEAGVPILDDCNAYAECTVSEVIDHGGDHELVVLEVVDITSRDELVPLTVRASPWEYGG